MNIRFYLKMLFFGGLNLTFIFSLQINTIALAQEADQAREEIIVEARETLNRAMEEGVPLLSPKNFASANEIYQNVLLSNERGESVDKIRENCQQALEYLSAGFEVAQNSRMVLETLIIMREQTIELTAVKLRHGRADPHYFNGKLLTESDFRDEQSYHIPGAESKFREAALRVETGDLDGARAFAREAEFEYISSAIEILKSDILHEARQRLSDSREDISAESFILANSELAALESFIDSQAARQLSISELSNELRNRAQHALDFTGIATPPRELPVLDIEVALEDLLALREVAMESAAREPAGELLLAAEEDYRRAVVQVEERNRIMDHRAALAAESAYREAILISLREGPLNEARFKLEESRESITPEEYRELVQNFEKAEGLFEQSQTPGISTKDFLDLIKKTKKWVFLSPNPPQPPSSLPDLIVELWSVPESQKKWSYLKWLSPYPPIKDKLTTVSAIVKNVGFGDVNKSFDTELYVDGKLVKTWTFSPFLKDENMQDALSRGETLVRDYAGKFSAGKHDFHWKVDTKKEVTESDESNISNELKASDVWKTSSDLPDLIVEAISHDGSLLVGDVTNWKIKIKNDGKTDATTPFMTSLKSAGVQFGAFWLDTLKAGDSKTFETKQSTSIIASQYTYKDTITGTVDVGNIIPEANENNNTKVKDFTVSYVDIAVPTLVITPKQPVVHEPVTFSFGIKNNGPADVTKLFKIRVMPGQVSAKGTTEPIILTFPKDKLPLKAGSSVNLKHKVTLAYATNYQVGVIADYSDPKGVYKKVYTEKNSANNTKTFNFDLKQTYYVKIAKIEYTDCNRGAIIHLDRSGGYWKGNVKITLMHGKYGPVKLHNPYSKNEITIPAYKNKSLEVRLRYADMYGRILKLAVYAVEGNKLIASSAPEKTLQFFKTNQLIIDSVSPSSGAKGSKVLITVKGKALSSSYSSYSPSVSAKSKKCTECPDYSGISIKVKSYMYDEVVAELDIKPNSSTGKKWIHIYAKCNGADAIPFTITDSKSQVPTTKEFTLYLKKQAGPLRGGKLPYAGSILPVPNGVLQTIKNVNTAMGNQWGVRIIKAGYTTNDCDKSKAVIDLAPGKSTSDLKGTSLSKGLAIVACIYNVQANVVPNMVALKITYTK